MAPEPGVYPALADEVEDNLRRHVLTAWFPRAVDHAASGFHQNFGEDWTPGRSGSRAIVYQARLTWLASQAARRFPAEATEYRAYARHGFAFLRDVLWDREHGGYFWQVAPQPEGGFTPDRGGEKHAYGIAFGIYAAAACHAETGEADTLDLARRAFAWLEEHAHDARNGGYQEALSREGEALVAAPVPGAKDPIGTSYGLRSMNTHIHLLEAFTALYEVWPDALVRRRLEETFLLVRDRIAGPEGYLYLYLTPDWQVVPDHDSFGHDVETGYLLVEAAHALGIPDDARARDVARLLVDHALRYGWDEEHGGFFDSGEPDGAVINSDKIWWTEAEGLNALLLMHERFGTDTDIYWNTFLRQWEFIQTRQTDLRHGGWFPTVGADGQPVHGRNKSDAWTEGYHQGRALLNVSAALRRLAEADRQR